MIRFVVFVVAALSLGGVPLMAGEPIDEAFVNAYDDAWRTQVMDGPLAPIPSTGGSPAVISEGPPIYESVPIYTPAPGAPAFLENYCGPDDWTWQLLPQGVLYHTYWASAAEPRLSTQVVDERGNGPYVDSHIGARLGLFRFGAKDRPEGWQFDILGGAKLRQNIGEELDVEAVDFRYDLLLTHAYGPHRWKFGFYHVSSHTGDEFLLKNPGYPRLNYFRDTFVMGYSYYVIPELRLYGEVGYAVHRDVSQPLEIQFGIDYGPAYKTGPQGAPFIALNGHLREEQNFGGNFAMQAGWAWKSDRFNDGILRTGLYLYDGASPQFSFYQRYERQVGIGLWYDY
jgi:hypothetical protein